MKTTVFGMGLHVTLRPYLDTPEYEDLDIENFETTDQALKTICQHALRGTKQFRQSFDIALLNSAAPPYLFYQNK